MYTALLIGFGKAGKRFFEVINYINKDRNIINLLGIIENDTKKTEKYNDSEFFTSCDDAFTKYKEIDLIFICSNEKDHYQNYQDIYRNEVKFKKIISEKPLTKDIGEANWVLNHFNPNKISLNFVERYSPICNLFKDFINEKGLKPYRILFFWGKNRVFDERPTIGTYSEISHPLDLLTFLCGKKNKQDIVEIEGYINSESGFCPGQLDTVDMISVNYTLNNDIYITGYSSFIWDKRNRKILIYLKDEKGKIYLCKLVFDNPNWDDDSIEITKIGKEKEVIFERKFNYFNVNKEIYGLNKIYNFILENIGSLSEGGVHNNLANGNQGYFIQEILENLNPNKSSILK